jgi:peptidoglycan/LPS O-acetylase OafA/YrhL
VEGGVARDAQERSASTVSPVTRHLRRLTSLRAFAAGFVFLFHCSGRLPHLGRVLANDGYTGVAFFFVLSGFVLTWSFDASRRRAAFYLRRVARIYPSYLVMLAVAAVVPVATSAVRLRYGAFDSLLLQSWAPPKLNPYTLNGVSWSLSCEAAFYVALPFVLPMMIRATSSRRWLIAVGYLAASSVVVIATAATHHGQDVAFVWPPIRFGEFLLGIVAALEIRRGWRCSARTASALVVLGIASIVAFHGFPASDVGATLIFFAVVVVAAQGDLLSPTTGWLTRRSLVYLGQVSFAFYLVHQLVILNVGDHYGFRGMASVPVLLLAALAAAVALHHIVERPFERRIRAIRLRGGQRVAETAVPVDG